MGTISKALNLFNYFTDQSPDLGLSDFTRLTGQDKATVHRHLTELERNGFLEQDQITKKYRLGSAILRLSALRERTFPLRQIVTNRVDQLSEEVHELVHASLIQPDEMSPLYFRDASVSATRVNFSLSELLPFHATASGIAALAFGTEALMERLSSRTLEKFTDNTTTDFENLRRLIGQVREEGIAFLDQTYEVDVCSLAVPFFETGRYARGTIAVAVPASRFALQDKARISQSLWNTAEMTTRELGGSIPEKLKSVQQSAA